MGFPLPAQDYVKSVLSMNNLCGITARQSRHRNVGRLYGEQPEVEVSAGGHVLI